MLIFFLFVVLIPLADFLLKNHVLNNVENYAELSTFIPFLKIAKVRNYGAAFGIFRGRPLFIILITVTVMIFLATMIFKKKNRDRFLTLSISFIIGGALGNLLDRLVFGYVVDYLKLTFFWPVCNLSDYFICVGVALTAIYYLKDSANS